MFDSQFWKYATAENATCLLFTRHFYYVFCVFKNEKCESEQLQNTYSIGHDLIELPLNINCHLHCEQWYVTRIVHFTKVNMIQ